MKVRLAASSLRHTINCQRQEFGFRERRGGEEDLAWVECIKWIMSHSKTTLAEVEAGTEVSKCVVVKLEII